MATVNNQALFQIIQQIWNDFENIYRLQKIETNLKKVTQLMIGGGVK